MECDSVRETASKGSRMFMCRYQSLAVHVIVLRGSAGLWREQVAEVVRHGAAGGCRVVKQSAGGCRRSFLLLVVWPGSTSSFLLLVAMPGFLVSMPFVLKDP